MARRGGGRAGPGRGGRARQGSGQTGPLKGETDDRLVTDRWRNYPDLRDQEQAVADRDAVRRTLGDRRRIADRLPVGWFMINMADVLLVVGGVVLTVVTKDQRWWFMTLAGLLWFAVVELRR